MVDEGSNMLTSSKDYHSKWQGWVCETLLYLKFIQTWNLLSTNITPYHVTSGMDAFGLHQWFSNNSIGKGKVV